MITIKTNQNDNPAGGGPKNPSMNSSFRLILVLSNCFVKVEISVKAGNVGIFSGFNENIFLSSMKSPSCVVNNSKLIHISTDAVFSGKEGNYTEDSPYSPVDFYGISKAAGKIKDDHNLTIRTSISVQK